MAQRITCHACGNVSFECNDGFYYCQRCGSQAEDMVETGVADEDFMGGDTHGAIYLQGHRRSKHTIVKTEPVTLQSESQTQPFWRTLTLDDDYKTPKKEDDDDVKPSVPNDFGGTLKFSSLSLEVILYEIRHRYVMGIQLMIQYQCQALVEKFGVSPLICGLAGVIWLRFVAVSRVFDDGWGNEIIKDSEVRKHGDSKVPKCCAKDSTEPQEINPLRALKIWFRSLRKRIPISSSLAVSFLACHIAREPIISTDILKWTLEGKLPYLTAFVDIERFFIRPSNELPLSSSFMFRPSQAVGSKELESRAGSVAQRIGLQLPPVNFYAIAHRYLKQLSLPVEKILPHAARVCEWSMPPDLWLSANLYRLPTHVCVMSILIVTIRVLYNINGFGKWEASLSNFGISSSCDRVEKSKSTYKSGKMNTDAKECSQSSDPTSKPEKRNDLEKSNSTFKLQYSANRCPPLSNFHEIGSSHVQNPVFDTAQLLCDLETTYDMISDTHEYSKDLPTYLKFCKDVAFAGLTPLYEEEKIIEQLWNFYENQEDSEAPKEAGNGCNSGLNRKRSIHEGFVNNVPMDNKKHRDEGCISSTSVDNETSDMDDCMRRSLDADGCSSSPQEDQTALPSGCASTETLKDRALRWMKSNMEENRFCYIPPRVNPKRFDYLHYVRKNDGGAQTYVAHADYYILLRACARLVQVDVRYMHAGVLKLEKRLAWIENRIDHSLHLGPANLPPKSNGGAEPPQDMDMDDSLDFSSYKFVI